VDRGCRASARGDALAGRLRNGTFSFFSCCLSTSSSVCARRRKRPIVYELRNAVAEECKVVRAARRREAGGERVSKVQLARRGLAGRSVSSAAGQDTSAPARPSSARLQRDPSPLLAIPEGAPPRARDPSSPPRPAYLPRTAPGLSECSTRIPLDPSPPKGVARRGWERGDEGERGRLGGRGWR